MIVDDLSRKKTNDKHIHTFLLQPGPSILASALKEKTLAQRSHRAAGWETPIGSNPGCAEMFFPLLLSL